MCIVFNSLYSLNTCWCPFFNWSSVSGISMWIDLDWNYLLLLVYIPPVFHCFVFTLEYVSMRLWIRLKFYYIHKCSNFSSLINPASFSSSDNTESRERSFNRNLWISTREFVPNPVTSFFTTNWKISLNTGSSKKMGGIWNRYNLKCTRRIYTFGILKCSEKFRVLDVLSYISIRAPFVALETSKRNSISCHIFWTMSRVTVSMADVILSCRCWIFLIFSAYTMFLMYPHRKKSSGERSGLRGGQVIGSPFQSRYQGISHLKRQSQSNWNGEELRLA